MTLRALTNWIWFRTKKRWAKNYIIISGGSAEGASVTGKMLVFLFGSCISHPFSFLQRVGDDGQIFKKTFARIHKVANFIIQVYKQNLCPFILIEKFYNSL
jgi:hypothetical protein